jgi:hypothetical protein
MVSMDEKWIPPTNFWEGATTIYDEDTDVWLKYWISFYTSLFMLFANEISPRTTNEAAFAGICIIIGAVITAVMFGQMTVLMSSLNRKMTIFVEKSDEANTMMKKLKLPVHLQDNINDYLIYTRGTLNNKAEFESFIRLLSPTLKQEVTDTVYDMIIKLNDLFAHEPEIHEYMTRSMNHNFFRPEEEIMSQGSAKLDTM